jgi:hypothetical protein
LLAIQLEIGIAKFVDIFMSARKIIEFAIIIVCSTNTGYLYQNRHIRYGFAKRFISTCKDCSKQQFERLEVKPRVITISTEVTAFESICKAIKGRVITMLLITMK